MILNKSAADGCVLAGIHLNFQSLGMHAMYLPAHKGLYFFLLRYYDDAWYCLYNTPE